MGKSKILYFMNTSWGWIKQRPHFLAEGLAEELDVTVLTKKTKSNKKSESDKVVCKTLYRLPYERFGIIAKINIFLYMIQCKRLVEESDILWLASPTDLSFVRYWCNGKIVVYDCMDDQIELNSNEYRKKIVSIWEKKLFDRADIVLASSDYLSEVLKSRYGDKKIFVVNNALKDNFENGSLTTNYSPISYFEQGFIHMSYIGTISSWMDFNLLDSLIKEFPNIVIHFFGPIDSIIPCCHDRIIFHGSVPHEYVHAIMNASDVLIMPFVVNELIKSVNPVKLYEYISSGKPCLAPLYGESEVFGDYVFLYDSIATCVDFIRDLIKNGFLPKKSIEDCRLFSNNNTWSSRVRVIYNIIANYIQDAKL